LEMQILKLSLGVIPSKFAPLPPPIPTFTGYSGGSMFVLGFFMLLIGITTGIGVMFFIWRRQRLSGLAYQVFE
uniref:Lectin n=1 Tax=Dracunculus medinensis TaxID=318479 RepID=A0A0N4UEW5_DRAME